MFGGIGLFSGDAMVGIVFDDRIYLKTDERTRIAFVDEGMGPFVYRARRTGGEIAMSYFEVPERLYDEPEEFAEWVRRAYEVAERSPSVQRKRRLAGVSKPAKRKKSARA
jgi:DNA transformation protein